MPAQHDLMKNTNALSILNYIRNSGAATRRKIQFATELSWATVSNITSYLLERNVLCENEQFEKGTGRTPSILDFAPDRNLCIGVEINIEGLTAVLLDLRCQVMCRVEEPVEVPEKDSVLKQLIHMLEKLMKEARITPSCLLGIGVAVQGSVDGDNSVSMYNHYFRNWRNVPLRDILEQAFGTTTVILHDPQCMAAYNKWKWSRGENDDFILIRLAYGIGMGYMVGGEVLRGYQGTAGELGHVIVNPDGPECICGNRGCLESYCSVRGIARRVWELSPDEDAPFDDDDVKQMETILEKAAAAARAGDETVKKIFDEAGDYLGVGIANVVNILNPKHIIISGALCSYSDLFMDRARSKAKQLKWPLSAFSLHMDNDRLGAPVGAALKLINDAFTGLDSKLLG